MERKINELRQANLERHFEATAQFTRSATDLWHVQSDDQCLVAGVFGALNQPFCT